MQLTVRDNGVGIPGSLDWRYTGSLGLHLVQMLTRQLRGTVDLSREGGTEFRFIIPVREGS
jgi:two-component sensor histidine kinase